MKSLKFKVAAFALLATAGCVDTSGISNAQAAYDMPRPALSVGLTVQGDQSGTAREFPVSGDASNYRAYVQAAVGERYRLNVRNNSPERIGVVIAVDGRNIISGAKSYLRNDERMYILEPYASGSYEGWRSSSNSTNRFFFTESGDSYAAAWGDNSAMGVIAMAVYPEKPRMPPPPIMYDKMEAAPAAAPAAPRAAPGTGYGESTYSPSHSVDFDPVSTPSEKVFLKYEWRDTLCQKHILPECRASGGNNRFWPEGGYAPPPPHR